MSSEDVGLNSTLCMYLEKEARKLHPDNFRHSEMLKGSDGFFQYAEDVNHDALDADKWLKNHTSYVWKVGVLSVVDRNKSDWAYLYIGHERSPGLCQFIGVLYWESGENDDVAACLKRALKCTSMLGGIFTEYPSPEPIEVTNEVDAKARALFPHLFELPNTENNRKLYEAVYEQARHALSLSKTVLKVSS